MKTKNVGFLLFVGIVVGGAVAGSSAKGVADLPAMINLPRIEKALSGGTTTQPSVFPDTTDALTPCPQIFVTGSTYEGQATSLFANGTSLLLTEGTTSGHTNVYAGGSSTPLVTTWGCTSGSTSTSATNPVKFYEVTNSFADYLAPAGNTGCSYYGGKMPASCTASNLLTGAIHLKQTGGKANWLVCGGGTATTGTGVMDLEGGYALEVVGDWGNANVERGVSGGITINMKNAYATNFLIGSCTGKSVVTANLQGSVQVTKSYLSTFHNTQLVVNGLLDKSAKVGLLPPGMSYTVASYSTDIPEGTQLIHASDAAYLANYRSVFSVFSSTTSSGTATGYTGTKGEIVQSGNYLIYTYPTTRLSAATPTSSYSAGVISGLKSGETYLLTDSAKTVHTVIADNNGQILVDKTTNPELIDKTISSIVQIRNESETDDSSAQSVSYTMPATLPTPTVTYANETLSGLVEGYDYTFAFSDGTSVSVKAADHSTSLSVLGQAGFYGKTITGVVRNSSNGGEIDSLSESVSIAVPGRYAAPETTFAEGIIASLKANAAYQLTYADSTGTSQNKTISTNADGAYLTYKDGDLTGMTITAITLVGDGGGLTSLPAVVSYVVPSQYPVVSPSYDASSSLLSGLLANATYILTDSRGTTYEIATGDATSINLAEHPELAGLSFASIQQKGDGKVTITSDKQASSLDYVAPSRRVDDGSLAGLSKDSFDPTTDTLSGLTPSTRYVVTCAEGSSTTKVVVISDSTGSVDLSTYPDLVGKTITGIALKGTNADGANSDHCDSLSTATSYQVLPHEATGTPIYDPATISITGLTPNVKYAFTGNDGKTYTGTSNSDGVLDPATLVDETDALIPGGSVLTAYVARGDQVASIDSFKQSLTSAITLPEREGTPASVYDSSEGEMSKLEALTSYRLTYLTQEGTKAVLEVTTTSEGLLHALDYPLLDQATIIGVQKNASSASMMISLSQETSYHVGLLSGVLSHKKALLKTQMEKRVAAQIVASSLPDKTALNQTMQKILAIYEQEVDDLSYTDSASFEEATDQLISRLVKEGDYETKRETVKEAIADLKRSCADDKRVNAVIAKYQGKLSTLVFDKDPSSSMDEILLEAKAEVKLATEKTAGVAQLSSGKTDPEKGMSEEEKKLYEDAVNKIDNATSQSEIDTIVSDYQVARNNLLAKEVASTQSHYAIFGYVILGIYVLFYVLYFGILRHHKLDGVYLIAWAAELILLVIISLLIKGNNPLVIALLWAFYVLSIPLVFLQKKKPEKEQEN